MPLLWLLDETVFSKMFQGVSQLTVFMPQFRQKMKLIVRNLSLSLINFSYKFSSGKWLDVK